jgi:hypothetical protein
MLSNPRSELVKSWTKQPIDLAVKAYVVRVKSKPHVLDLVKGYLHNLTDGWICGMT